MSRVRPQKGVRQRAEFQVTKESDSAASQAQKFASETPLSDLWNPHKGDLLEATPKKSPSLADSQGQIVPKPWIHADGDVKWIHQRTENLVSMFLTGMTEIAQSEPEGQTEAVVVHETRCPCWLELS